MKLVVTIDMARSLLDAARESRSGRVHNPEISFDCESREFRFGSNLSRGEDEVDFITEGDVEDFVSNWFGTGAPSRFRLSDARHCVECCIQELEDHISELETA